MEQITTTNLITIVASTVLVIGWFVNGFIQRKHEIAKERFKFRMEMLKESIDLLNTIKALQPNKYINYFTSSEFKNLFIKVDKLFFLYGEENELSKWKQVATQIRSNTINEINLMSYVDDCITILRKNIRKELNLSTA